MSSFYLTTPIYYVNAAPHIGHTYTNVVADTLARYHRLRGDETFLLTGTDEHGEKVLAAARADGRPPAEVADALSGVFRSTWDALGLSYDRFIRTTEPAHKSVVSGILQRVYDLGKIDFREYEGSYCVGCERFLTERDMKGGLCIDHERPPEHRRESNYFFRMSEHFAWLEEYVRTHDDFIRPERYRNEVLGMLREDSGLGDLCISRPKDRLDWGIELPFDREYVCYVWFDALINYLTGIGYPDGPDFESRWASSTHLIAKDILKPHAIFWPTMLRALDLPPPRRLRVHGYWNVDARKVSKSLGNMVSPLAMRDSYGFEGFRYYLLRDMVFGQDASFSEDALVARINADLANNLGNLASRALNMTGRYADGVVPQPAEDGPDEAEVRARAAACLEGLDRLVERLDFRAALEAILGVVDATNVYLEKCEPWKAAKQAGSEGRVATALFTCCEALRVTAIMLAPFLPTAADEILLRLGLSGGVANARLPDSAAWEAVPIAGLTTRAGPPLFPRIERAEAEGD